MLRKRRNKTSPDSFWQATNYYNNDFRDKWKFSGWFENCSRKNSKSLSFVLNRRWFDFNPSVAEDWSELFEMRGPDGVFHSYMHEVEYDTEFLIYTSSASSFFD